VLITPKHVARENETIAETWARMKWEQDVYIYKGHICNAMVDSLFDIYQSKSTAKDVWDILEAKYLLKDATSKKFLTSKFMNYRMVDARPIVEHFIFLVFDLFIFFLTNFFYFYFFYRYMWDS
jgi:hypothetical protein